MAVVTLRGIINLLKTTRNFWSVPTWVSSKRKKIVFRNGLEMDLSNREYWVLREVLSKGCAIESANNKLFTIKKDTASYDVEQLDKDLLSIKKGRVRIIGPFEILNAIADCAAGSYECNCKDKVILDVGGLFGETAILFWDQGAKRILIYEPVLAHHQFIKKNVTLNGVSAKLYGQGIGNKDGYQTIHYDAITSGFGPLSKGKYRMKIKVRDVSTVIEESHAEIAKFDCEGAEGSLIHVPNSVLRKIDLYMIETHTSKITEAIIDKFDSAGFKLLRKTRNSIHKTVSIVHFEKKGGSNTHNAT